MFGTAVLFSVSPHSILALFLFSTQLPDPESLLQVDANRWFRPTTLGVIDLGFTGFKHIPSPIYSRFVTSILATWNVAHPKSPTFQVPKMEAFIYTEYSHCITNIF